MGLARCLAKTKGDSVFVGFTEEELVQFHEEVRFFMRGSRIWSDSLHHSNISGRVDSRRAVYMWLYGADS